MTDSLELRCVGSRPVLLSNGNSPAALGPAMGDHHIGAQLAKAFSKALAGVTAANHQQTLARAQWVDSS